MKKMLIAMVAAMLMVVAMVLPVAAHDEGTASGDVAVTNVMVSIDGADPVALSGYDTLDEVRLYAPTPIPQPNPWSTCSEADREVHVITATLVAVDPDGDPIPGQSGSNPLTTADDDGDHGYERTVRQERECNTDGELQTTIPSDDLIVAVMVTLPSFMTVQTDHDGVTYLYCGMSITGSPDLRPLDGSYKEPDCS